MTAFLYQRSEVVLFHGGQVVASGPSLVATNLATQVQPPDRL
jgi:hypothetical protein